MPQLPISAMSIGFMVHLPRNRHLQRIRQRNPPSRPRRGGGGARQIPAPNRIRRDQALPDKPVPSAPASINSAASFAFVMSLAGMITVALFLASSLAAWKPIPDVAPVTKASLPAYDGISCAVHLCARFFISHTASIVCCSSGRVIP